jgi:hypothetical protein
MPAPLWTCPTCRRTFASANQTHRCAALGDLAAHFAGKPPLVRTLFDRVLKTVQACGPVTVLPEKTRIAFHVRMSFMVVATRQFGLRGHFVLDEIDRHPRFTKIQTYSARNHVHEFRVITLGDIDADFARWVKRAYAVGQQRHRRGRSDARRQKRPSASSGA